MQKRPFPAQSAERTTPKPNSAITPLPSHGVGAIMGVDDESDTHGERQQDEEIKRTALRRPWRTRRGDSREIRQGGKDEGWRVAALAADHCCKRWDDLTFASVSVLWVGLAPDRDLVERPFG